MCWQVDNDQPKWLIEETVSERESVFSWNDCVHVHSWIVHISCHSRPDKLWEDEMIMFIPRWLRYRLLQAWIHRTERAFFYFCSTYTYDRRWILHLSKMWFSDVAVPFLTSLAYISFPRQSWSCSLSLLFWAVFFKNLHIICLLPVLPSYIISDQEICKILWNYFQIMSLLSVITEFHPWISKTCSYWCIKLLSHD